MRIIFLDFDGVMNTENYQVENPHETDPLIPHITDPR